MRLASQPAATFITAGLLLLVTPAVGLGQPVPMGVAGASSGNGVVFTIAGTSESPLEGGYGGDGGLAAFARLDTPAGIDVTRQATLLVADTVNDRVRAIHRSGRIETVAGGGPGTGGAEQASGDSLERPTDVAALPSGGFVIADWGHHRVVRVDSAGSTSTLAGTGERGFGGDGGPAVLAQLDHPSGVGVGADGTLLIADTGNHRIRAVRPDGTIDTIAGSGSNGSVGDGGSATSAAFSFPTDVALLADGAIGVADSENNRIRQIDNRGQIRTVAGNGHAGAAGDGRPATLAELRRPLGIAPLAHGGFLIADAGNGRVRRVGRNGTISTVTGRVRGPLGDGGPARAASLTTPSGVVETALGEIAIADTDNHRVRLIASRRTTRLGLAVRRAASGSRRTSLEIVATVRCRVRAELRRGRRHLVKRQTLKPGRNVVVLRGELRRVRHHVDLHARAASGVRGGFSAIMRVGRTDRRLGRQATRRSQPRLWSRSPMAETGEFDLDSLRPVRLRDRPEAVTGGR